MQTYRTNQYDDRYRHVCLKDLEYYMSKDEFLEWLAGLSDAEKWLFRKILDVPNNIKIDHYIDSRSRNAVENSAIYEALLDKVDKKHLNKVAVTGNYNDLRNTPVTMPNPEILIIKDLHGQTLVYDGNKSVMIKLPQSITDFDDWSKYYTPLSDIEDMIPIKGIYLNGKKLTPDECKNISINTDEYVTKDKIATLETKVDNNAELISKVTRVVNNLTTIVYGTEAIPEKTLNEILQ